MSDERAGRRYRWVCMVTAGLSMGWLFSGAASASEASCDRACLHKVLDQYLDAVFKHDPTAAHLASNARATVNAAPLANGSGIWQSLSGYGSVQRRYFDPTTGQALYFGLMDESGQTDIVAVRVKVERHRVTEAEWTVARKEAGGMFSIEGLTGQPPPPDTPIPARERTSRANLIAAANAYFDGLQTHDGSNVPHIAGCERIENGIKVTNRDRSTPLGPMPGGGMPVPGGPGGPGTTPGVAQETPAANGSGAPNLAQESKSGDCAAGFEMFKNSIQETSHRRFNVVDEQAGVVVGQTLFRRPPGSTLKRNLLTELFWEKDGKISAIYAAMYYLDANAPDTPGW